MLSKSIPYQEIEAVEAVDFWDIWLSGWNFFKPPLSMLYLAPFAWFDRILLIESSGIRYAVSCDDPDRVAASIKERLGQSAPKK